MCASYVLSLAATAAKAVGRAANPPSRVAVKLGMPAFLAPRLLLQLQHVCILEVHVELLPCRRPRLVSVTL